MITQMSAAITPDSVRSIAHQLPLYFHHPDPDQPFLNRGNSGQSNRNNLETILMMRSSTHLTVPCRVTVPDLNVTLHTVCSHQFLFSSAYSLEVLSHPDSVVLSQYPLPLDTRQITWDNKRGWSIPRWVIDSSPLLISVYCAATLGGKEFESTAYLIHVTGESGRT